MATAPIPAARLAEALVVIASKCAQDLRAIAVLCLPTRYCIHIKYSHSILLI